jgi:hypothetical protein
MLTGLAESAAGWDASTWINLGSAVGQVMAALLAGIALVVSARTFKRQTDLQRWQLRVARESHIIDWAEACITEMAEVETMISTSIGAAPDDLMAQRVITAMARVSALIDRGRLFFPNIIEGDKGADKDDAYKGSRQKVLDHLVAYYDVMGRSIRERGRPLTADDHTTLNAARRRFISEAQKKIDPRRFASIAEH